MSSTFAHADGSATPDVEPGTFIGMLDSGLGGFSVLVPLRRHLPDLDVLYIADRGRAPYGPRPLDEVRAMAEEITEHLVTAGAGLIVVACNSASAAALHTLRRLHPEVPFVGMEPAVKPAAETTRSGVIGVLTTQATFQSELLASVVDRFAGGAKVVPRVCDGWVELVERGEVTGAAAEAAVEHHVAPLLAAGADTLVLGCTHYPFLAPLIARIAGPEVTILDPADAVALQASRVAALHGIGAGSGSIVVETTGETHGLAPLIERLAGLAVSVKPITFASPS